VREPVERVVGVWFRPGDRVSTRMPTWEERQQYGIRSGVPVLVVGRVSGEVNLLAGDANEVGGAAAWSAA
jgi:hypothetical protein